MPVESITLVGGSILDDITNTWERQDDQALMFPGGATRQIEGETHKHEKIASAGTERQTKLQILPDVNGLLATTKEGLVFSYCR